MTVVHRGDGVHLLNSRWQDPVMTDQDRRELTERLQILDAIAVGAEQRVELLEIVASSPDAESARARVSETFGLNLAQSAAILDMQIRRFAAKERNRLTDERDDVRRRLL
jgi:DNA gyrase subunit A